MVNKKKIKRRDIIECKCPGCGRLWKKDMLSKSFKIESFFCECELGKKFDYTLIRKG